MRVRNRSWSWTFFVFSLTTASAAAFVFVACDDETGTAPQTPDATAVGFDSSTTPPSGNDGSVPGADAGADAEEIGDGGGLPPEEDDSGLTDPDGGFDAGAACAVLTTGAFVNTQCSSRVQLMAGGALTTTNYQLASVVVIGSPTFCGNVGDAGYKEFLHRGALEVTADTPTTGTFEFVDQYRRPGALVVRATTVRYDVKVTAAGNGLVYTAQPCATKAAPPSATFTISAVAGSNKKAIVLRLPYGTGFALYRYVEP
jgi:hypothetical protein